MSEIERSISDIDSDEKLTVRVKTEHKSRKITIYIQDQNNIKRRFSTKRTEPIKPVLLRYSRKEHYHYPSLRFVLDGERINVNMSPEELGLEHGEIIEVFFTQTGGGTRDFRED